MTRSAPLMILKLLQVLLLFGSIQAQTITVRLIERWGQPLQIHIQGSITELGTISTVVSLDETRTFQNQLIGLADGFYLVGPNTRGHREVELLNTRSDMSGCQDLSMYAPLQGSAQLPTVGFTTTNNLTTEGSAAVILPSDYRLGSFFRGSAFLPGVAFLSELGWEGGRVCSLEWNGANAVQRIEFVSVVQRPPTQVARLELFEDYEKGTVQIVGRGRLSDTSGLRDPVLVGGPETGSPTVVFGTGFYVANPGVDSELYAIQGAKSQLRGCEGFSFFRTFSLEPGSTLPSFGFDAASANNVIVNLPLNYQAGQAFRGTATIANSSYADMNITAGARCYAEWPTDSGVFQRLVLATARPTTSTLYMKFTGVVIPSFGVDYSFLDPGCTDFLQKELVGRVHNVRCSITHGINYIPNTVEMEVVVTGMSMMEDSIADRIHGSYKINFFSGERTAAEANTVIILDTPSASFSTLHGDSQLIGSVVGTIDSP